MCGFGFDADMVLTMCASFALVRSKVVARSALSPALWIIWSVDNLVTALCVVSKCDWEDGGFNFCVEAFATFVVMILAVRYGQVRFTSADKGDLLSCLAGAFVWGVATAVGFSWVGELALLTLGTFGTIAFYRSLGRDPHSEVLSVWMLFLLADCCALFSFHGESLVGMGFIGLELSTSAGAVVVGLICGYLAFLRRFRSVRRRDFAQRWLVPVLNRRRVEERACIGSRYLLLSHVLADA